VAEVPRSSAHDVPLLQTFQASTSNVKDTTVELSSIAAQYAASNKVAQIHPAPYSSREASLNITITIQDAEEGAKGGKKRCKQHR
jgi:hypothetical protein